MRTRPSFLSQTIETEGRQRKHMQLGQREAEAEPGAVIPSPCTSLEMPQRSCTAEGKEALFGLADEVYRPTVPGTS